MKKWIRRVIIPALALLIMDAFTGRAQAQGLGEESVFSAVDTVWVLIAAFLVFFIQCGFGFLEAGFVRSKNVVNIMAENIMDTTATTVGLLSPVLVSCFRKATPYLARNGSSCK